MTQYIDLPLWLRDRLISAARDCLDAGFEPAEVCDIVREAVFAEPEDDDDELALDDEPVIYVDEDGRPVPWFGLVSLGADDEPS